ncbi:MAG: 8-oxo-dGTP diphosphatase MutT [Tepidisphaeraceae bacterium]
MKHLEVAIAIVSRNGQVLICQRNDDVPLPNYWEFPGGKIERGETPEACAAREVMEETGIRVRPMRALEIIEHTYPDTHVRLHPFLCDHESGEPHALQCKATRWVTPEALGDHRFPPANDRLIKDLISHFASPTGPQP